MQTTRVYTYVCWYYGLTYKRALHWISTCNRLGYPKTFGELVLPTSRKH